MVNLYGYAEISPDGLWVFAGRMVPNPEREWDSDAPELMPEALLGQLTAQEAADLLQFLVERK